MSVTQTFRDLTREEYELFRRLVYEHSGINLGAQKMQLVRARLGKRLRAGGFPSFRAYYEHIVNDPTGQELGALLDAISTNTTHLFREKSHFDFLRTTIGGWLADPQWRRRNRELRIWSCACSSGEEAYSIAMTAHDALRCAPQTSLRILATDISTRMLAKARRGLYEPHRLGTVPEDYHRRYFVMVQHEGQRYAQIVPELRQLITFVRFNLMSERYPFRNRFHFIFCRNVMIYFDRPTQQKVITKLAAHIAPGGYLIIGHSESLSALSHPLRYIRPTIYQNSAS